MERRFSMCYLVLLKILLFDIAETEVSLGNMHYCFLRNVQLVSSLMIINSCKLITSRSSTYCDLFVLTQVQVLFWTQLVYLIQDDFQEVLRDFPGICERTIPLSESYQEFEQTMRKVGITRVVEKI